ncbi:galanin peptides isoform X2 [Bubalus bubalis]|uniref:galanin peptides isoform X2 n=1 Tax=Bubalus bubalis TaxID=89462 RepID=UPI001D10605C|nr:galanin peptides isoform X2 [Bubalus bubalis]
MRRINSGGGGSRRGHVEGAQPPCASRFRVPEAPPCGERPWPCPTRLDGRAAPPTQDLQTPQDPQTSPDPPGPAQDAQRLRPAARLPAPGSGPFSHPGPRVTDAIDNHRSFQDKHGLAGKRELEPEDEARPGSFDRPLAENNVVRTIIEFLTFLHLKGDIDFYYLNACPVWGLTVARA